MDHPSLPEFEAAARREGYDEVAERTWPANAAVETHQHPFAVKAIVVAGAQVPGAVAFGEPHLAGDDESLHRERMLMGLDHRIRRPDALGHLVEALAARRRLEFRQAPMIHRIPR